LVVFIVGRTNSLCVQIIQRDLINTYSEDGDCWFEITKSAKKDLVVCDFAYAIFIMVYICKYVYFTRRRSKRFGFFDAVAFYKWRKEIARFFFIYRQINRWVEITLLVEFVFFSHRVFVTEH